MKVEKVAILFSVKTPCRCSTDKPPVSVKSEQPGNTDIVCWNFFS